MADKKISALTSLAQGDVAASTDVLPIVDTSATETKKITASALVGAGMTAGVTNVDINSGAIDGTTIGANSAAAGTFTNLTASGTVSFSGATVSNGGAVTTIDINGGTIDATSIGASSASTGAFTTLTTSSTVTLNGGTANGVLYLNGSKVATSGTALTFDGTNLGVAVTPSAWGSIFRAVQVGTGGSIFGRSSGSQDVFQMGANVFWDGSNWKYIGNGASTRYEQATGTHVWSYAASGTAGNTITFTEAMTLTSTGLGIGTTPTQKLSVATASGNCYVDVARASKSTGQVALQLSGGTSGTNWIIYQPTNSDNLTFFGNSSDRMVLDSSGNLGLGVTPSAWRSSSKAIQVGSTAAFRGDTGVTSLSSNVYINSSNQDIYLTTAAATSYAQTTGQHLWFTAPSGTAGNTISFTQAMTLDASGNLLLGTTTSTLGRLEVVGGAGIRVNEDAAGTKVISIRSAFAGGDPAINVSTNHPLTFLTNNTERARITSGGKWLVNTTSTAFPGIELVQQATSADECASFWNSATSGDNNIIKFYTDGGSGRGNISYNRAGGLIAYNTTSDYRAKDILGPVADPGATIDALKVYEGQMKGATQSRPMLIAHEAQEIAPYAVTGKKDAVNDDGDPIYQQMDHSSLVPLLIAEVKSLRARVAALESK